MPGDLLYVVFPRPWFCLRKGHRGGMNVVGVSGQARPLRCGRRVGLNTVLAIGAADLRGWYGVSSAALPTSRSNSCDHAHH